MRGGASRREAQSAAIKVDNERTNEGNLLGRFLTLTWADACDARDDGHAARGAVLVHAGDAPAFGTFLDVAALGHDE